MKTRTLMLALVMFIATVAIGFQSSAQEKESQLFFIVKDMPEYPGGPEALLKDISSQVKYPKKARKNGITGKIYVNFVVAKNGKITNASIARGVNPLLDKEALRVINNLGKTWKPGIQEEKPIDVTCRMLFDFKKDGEVDVTPPPPPPSLPPLPKVVEVWDIVDDTVVIDVAPVIETKEETEEDEAQVFFIVEDMPEFPGGDLALRQYIANAIEYPVIAQDNGIHGKVYVTFVVGKTGKVINSSIARGVAPSLDKEALRVVNKLPTWKPGKQLGKPVNVSYTVPIIFRQDGKIDVSGPLPPSKK